MLADRAAADCNTAPDIVRQMNRNKAPVRKRSVA
jgi:hypothetical protein